MDAGLGEDAVLETELRGERRGLVEPLHRGQEDRPLIGVGQQLHLERELHARIVGSIRSG